MSMSPEAGRLREKLLGRIRGRYQITEKNLQIGPISLLFTRVVDPDVVLNQIADAEDVHQRLTGKPTPSDDLHLPYWAELWDSALAIGAWIARAPVARSLNVLDLGCGMGLSGAVAAAKGHRVMFADLEQPALLFAALNSAAWHSRVRTRQLNWQTDRMDERFDLIFGADILYERKQWEYLEPFWRHHLSFGGRVLLGEPGRQTGEMFVDWIRGRDWKLEESLEAVTGREKPIRLFHLAL